MCAWKGGMHISCEGRNEARTAGHVSPRNADLEPKTIENVGVHEGGEGSMRTLSTPYRDYFQ